MTVRGYVLIQTKVGKTNEVVEAIRKLQGVVSVDVVTGPYNAIATVHGETLSEIGDLVTGKVHPISGIARTVTCLAMKESF
jgi:DNA-binding Lrp family transcriptional regulator